MSSGFSFPHWLMLWSLASPWTSACPFVQRVLDCFGGTPWVYLVMAWKSVFNFHLLGLITKCLWKDFSLICCHKQPHITLLWTCGVRWLDWKFMVRDDLRCCRIYIPLSTTNCCLVKFSLCDNNIVVLRGKGVRSCLHFGGNQTLYSLEESMKWR